MYSHMIVHNITAKCSYISLIPRLLPQRESLGTRLSHLNNALIPGQLSVPCSVVSCMYCKLQKWARGLSH